MNFPRKTAFVSTWNIGFSSCPNDTFMFDALLQRRGQLADFDYPIVEPTIADIEALNRAAIEQRPGPEITKLSVAALARCEGRYRVLRSGAALGRGVGPLVLARPEQAARWGGRGVERLRALEGARVAIPGDATTANLLLRLFAPAGFEPQILRFEQIMPAIAAGEVDAGVVIHESRFTFADYGLQQIADLGEIWETSTDLPLPLGVICAREDLDDAAVDAFERALGLSIEHAMENPGDSWSFISSHAQELSPKVCRAHIELYVNAYSLELGDEGVRAIRKLIESGAERGVLPPVQDRVWRPNR